MTFIIEKRADIYVIIGKHHGIIPASEYEIELWEELQFERTRRIAAEKYIRLIGCIIQDDENYIGWQQSIHNGGINAQRKEKTKLD